METHGGKELCFPLAGWMRRAEQVIPHLLTLDDGLIFVGQVHSDYSASTVTQSVIAEDTLKEVITPERLRQDTTSSRFLEAPGARQRMSPVNGRGGVKCLEPLALSLSLNLTLPR